MAERRKRTVTIISEDAVLAWALRQALAHHDVQLSTRESVDEHMPDVVVLHVSDQVRSHDLNALAQAHPTVVLGPPDATNLIQAVEAGSRAFVSMDAPLEEIVDSVDTVVGGGAVVPPALLGTLLRHLVNKNRRVEADDGALSTLTPRENEVFELAARGARKDHIAESLYISRGTARTHLQRVYRKLGVHSHAELVALAARIGRLDTAEES